MSREKVLNDLTAAINYNADKLSRLSGWIQKATKGGLLPEEPDQKLVLGPGRTIKLRIMRQKYGRAKELHAVLRAARDQIREDNVNIVPPRDPVHYFDGNKSGFEYDTHHTTPGWYFWEETWQYAIGPHQTEDEAKAALAKYAESLTTVLL